MCEQYEAGFFASLTKVVVELLSDAFPELAGNIGTGMTPEKVAEVILDEEVRWLGKTLILIIMVSLHANLPAVSPRI